jgi:hypothetical protein
MCNFFKYYQSDVKQRDPAGFDFTSLVMMLARCVLDLARKVFLLLSRPRVCAKHHKIKESALGIIFVIGLKYFQIM